MVASMYIQIARKMPQVWSFVHEFVILLIIRLWKELDRNIRPSSAPRYIYSIVDVSIQLDRLSSSRFCSLYENTPTRDYHLYYIL